MASPPKGEGHGCPSYIQSQACPELVEGDVKLRAGKSPESNTCASGKLLSMALDSGIHDRDDAAFRFGGTFV